MIGLQTRPHIRALLLALSMGLVAILVSACSLGGSGGSGGSSSTTNNNSGDFIISQNNISPIPTFPPVTIGAWMSNMTPTLGDTITLYALVRNQPADMKSASQPAVGVSVSAAGNIGSAAQQQTTDADGLAKFTFQASGTPGQPQVITVITQGVSTNTFYTILPTAPQPTTTPTK